MRIAILTGGGDVAGLNPCIKAIVTDDEALGWEAKATARWGSQSRATTAGAWSAMA